jgi:hypothetical protein
MSNFLNGYIINIFLVEMDANVNNGRISLVN